MHNYTILVLLIPQPNFGWNVSSQVCLQEQEGGGEKINENNEQELKVRGQGLNVTRLA